MTEAIIEIVVQVIGALAVTAITLAGAWLTSIIGKKTQLMNINIAKDEVISAAVITVGELQQTTVEKLKAASADGKLTQEEITALGKALVEGTINKLSEPAHRLLRAAGVDLLDLIHGAAEDWLNAVKTEKIE
jgi:hypothetical protein